MENQETALDIKELKKCRLKVKMLEALESTLGVVTAAAELVGITRQTHYVWFNADPVYKEAVLDIGNKTIDFAEHELLKQIKEGNTTAIIFFLKCRAKDRGYIDKQVVEANITGPIKMYAVDCPVDDV